MTSSIGVAALNALAPVFGYYLFEIRKEGYTPEHFKLEADTASEFLVSLAPNPLGKATQLPAVVTTERRRITQDLGQREGFFARCQMAVVECVGRKDLDLEPTGLLADLLAKTSGVYRQCVGGARPTFRAPSQPAQSGCTVSMKTNVGPPPFCTPTYFLNGFEWAPLAGKSEAQIDQFLSSSAIEGMEIYLSEVPRPPRFNVPGNACGAIVVWTR